MAQTINADDGSVSGSSGLKSSSDGTAILALQTKGTTAVTIDGSQNVGIGTTSPAAALSVSKQTTALSGTGNSYGLYMYPTSTGLCYIDALTNSTSNTSLGLRTYNNGTYNEVRIDSSGRLTVPNQPCFTVYGSTTQSWSGTAAYQIIQFNTKYSSLNDAGFNTSTYTYTAPVTGRYLISLKITQTTTVTGPSASIYVNGSAVGTEMVIAYSTAYMSSSATVILYLAANDAVTARASNFNNVSMTLDLSRCLFSGYLIG